MYSNKWSEAELEQLAKAEANDVATWPERSVKDLESLQGERPSWEEESYTGLARVRELILDEAIKKRLVQKYSFIGECVDALYAIVGKETLGWKIVQHLELWAPYGLASDVIEECLDLVPKLNRVLPFEDLKEILAAMKEA